MFGPVLQVVTPHKRNTGVEPQLSPAVAGLPRVRLPGPGCDKKVKETPPAAETHGGRGVGHTTRVSLYIVYQQPEGPTEVLRVRRPQRPQGGQCDLI